MPPDLAPALRSALCAHFAEDASVRVVVERRRRERRSADRRAAAAGDGLVDDRRRVRATAGRRLCERRAAAAVVQTPALPAVAATHVQRLRFVQRIERSRQQRDDLELARLVIAFQSGRPGAFDELYGRCFGPVFRYLRSTLKDAHDAEDAAQQVMVNVLQTLRRFELRPGTPFRAWLFRIARNEAATRLKQRARTRVEEPEQLDRLREAARPDTVGPSDWLSDCELMCFVDRLPLAQRQALALRYVHDLSSEEIGAVLGRSGGAVRHLELRALRSLETRLRAIGHGAARPPYAAAAAPAVAAA